MRGVIEIWIFLTEKVMAGFSSFLSQGEDWAASWFPLSSASDTPACGKKVSRTRKAKKEWILFPAC